MKAPLLGSALLLLAFVSPACSQQLAEATLPIVSLTLQVIDDDGQPVAEAQVGAGTAIGEITNPPGGGFPRAIGRDVERTTDGKGQVALSLHSGNGEVGFRVSKADYYPFLSGDYRSQSEGKDGWEPANPLVTALIRRRVNPVPLYARRLETKMPASEQDCGYDLLEGDWVAPAGRGKTSDLVFRADGRYQSSTDYDTTLTLRFSNPGDGLVAVPGSNPSVGCLLRLPRLAPEDGYVPRRAWHKARLPGQGSEQFVDESSGYTNYFFRVRTVLDTKGHVVSALYGKAYGDFKFAGAFPGGGYLLAEGLFLNPTPNDRNLEFDTTRNLATELESTLTVVVP